MHDTGLPYTNGVLYFGRCTKNPFDGTCRVDLSLEALEPLLRNDLTPAERLLDTFRVAAILLHEVCVSMPILTSSSET